MMPEGYAVILLSQMGIIEKLIGSVFNTHPILIGGIFEEPQPSVSCNDMTGIGINQAIKALCAHIFSFPGARGRVFQLSTALFFCLAFGRGLARAGVVLESGRFTPYRSFNIFMII